MFQFLEMVRERRPAHAGLRLDFVDDQAVGVSREEEADDSKPRLGSEGGEHVGKSRDVPLDHFHNYISTILEM